MFWMPKDGRRESVEAEQIGEFAWGCRVLDNVRGDHHVLTAEPIDVYEQLIRVSEVDN